MRATYLVLCSLVACPAAGDISLQIPLDCTLGQDCFIQQFVDHDPGDGARDFHCASLTYDGHQGTDFALTSIAAMEQGFDVLAAASGTVRGVRDGMVDRIYRSEHAEDVGGRDCGNGVAITHENGWTTQYCHLKRGSVTVRSGDRVQAGDVLGRVGLSGRTQFPHVHMTVRHNDVVIDPFDPDGQVVCGAPSTETLWSDPPDYVPGGILRVGFADAVPEFDAIKAGSATRTTLPTNAPALVLFAYAFGARSGDTMRLQIDGPDGPFMDELVTLNRTQAQLFRAVGRRLHNEAAPGTYTGTVALIRDTVVVSEEIGTVTLR